MSIVNLLHNLEIQNFTIAGFDGFKNQNNYYDKTLFEDGRFDKEYEDLMVNMKIMLNEYSKKLKNPQSINFITPSIYQNIFE